MRPMAPATSRIPEIVTTRLGWGIHGGTIAISPARRGCKKWAVDAIKNAAASPHAVAAGHDARYGTPAPASRAATVTTIRTTTGTIATSI